VSCRYVWCSDDLAVRERGNERERAKRERREPRGRGERDKEGDGVCVMPVCVMIR